LGEKATQTKLKNGNSNILDNDTDPDNIVTTSSHSVTLLGTTNFGNLSLNTNGTFSYTHTQSEKFRDSVFYVIDDGIQKDTAMTLILISPINDHSPIGVSDSIVLNEGDSSSLLNNGFSNLISNDTDSDLIIGDSIWIKSLIDSSTHGRFERSSQGTFTYFSNASSEIFKDSVYYIITDGLFNDSVKLYININPINDESPLAYSDSLKLIEGDIVQLTVLGDSSLIQRTTDLDSLIGNQVWVSMLLDTSFYGALTIDSSGKFSYVHNHSENFKDSFSYEISDGLFKDTAWMYISIIPTNDLKVEGLNDTLSLDEGALGSINLLQNDSLNLEQSDTLSLDTILVSTKHGSITSNSLGDLSYQHDSTESFKDSLSYVVFDGLFKDTLWLMININPINDQSPIRIDTIANINKLEDFSDTLKLSWLGLFDDSDSLVGNTLSYSINTLTGQNGLSYQSLATGMNITSQSDSNGLIQLELIASDGKFEAKDTFEINITAVNDAPHLDSSS
jgi:large repetitive protein